VKFLGKKLAPHTGPFIVAEISCNHQGSLDQAYKLIQAAKDAGADAVKIQVYTPDEMTIEIQNDFSGDIAENFYCKDGPWKGRQLYELYNKNQTPLEWVPNLFWFASSRDIPMFASVFGEQSLEALEKINCPAYKIASFEANYVPFLKKVLAKGKPVIVSTGCSDLGEIEQIIDIIKNNLVLMHCVSKYPAVYTEAQLETISVYRKLFSCPIGFSDHDMGDNSGIGAIILGTSILEKHLKLEDNKSDDDLFSLTPADFQIYIKKCRNTVKAYQMTGKSEFNQYKRSIYVVSDIKEGEQFTEQNIRCIRPGYGLEPKHYERVLTFTATRDINRGEALVTDMVKWNSKLP
jgi:pseudaminic acid synthase